MRSVILFGNKWDRRYLICAILAIISAILSDIVIFKILKNNEYMQIYAFEYAYRVCCFKNGSLILKTIINEGIYLYACFCLSRFTRFKFFTLPIIFTKCFIGFAYVIIFFTAGLEWGLFVAVFVYLPYLIISVAILVFATETAKLFKNKISIFVPAIYVIVECIVLLLLVNVLFRVIVSIA